MEKTQRVEMLSTEFQPKNEFILIKPEDHKKEISTPSGIIVPLNHSILDRPTSGTVIARGSEINDIPIGAFVMWPNTDGLDIEFIDCECILLQEKSIIGFKKV